jgi:catechol 2,3-dioxygenase-like lactoylglutathione lyase family enzyme
VAVLGIDHVQIAAPPGCERAARAFYGDLLGMLELPKPKELRARGGVWFAAGAQELHIGVADPFVPAGKAHPGFVVDDVDRLHGRLVAAGLTPEWDAAIAGVRRLFVLDPFGNRLEARQSVAVEL